MEGYLVKFYNKEKMVYERICKSSTKFNAVNTAIRDSVENKDFTFDGIKIYKVKLSYEIIAE
jgi:hypothetical protein